MAKDGALSGQALADYQAAWNKQNGANAAYSQAAAAGKPAGAVQLLTAPPGYQAPPSYGGGAPAGGANAASLQQMMSSLGFGNSGAGAGGGLSSTSSSSGVGVGNTAAANPDLAKLQAMYQERYAQLQGANKPNDELTKRMMNLATGKINDAAAGSQQQLSENLARRGVAGGGGGGIEGNLRGRVAESAQRAGAGARANIAVGRAGQEEQASLARDQSLNNLLLGGQGIMGSQAQLQLANQELALRQYQIQQQAELARRSEAMQAFTGLIGLFS